MSKYKIVYTGATTETVEAKTEAEALELFWSDFKDLSDVEIVSVDMEG